MLTHVHPKGWQISAPQSLAVRATPQGFALTDGSRALDGIDIEVRSGSPPDGAWHKRRSAVGAPARFRILVVEGGMGGPEYELQIWQPRVGGHVWLKQREQREWPDRPNFELGWQIFTSL